MSRLEGRAIVLTGAAAGIGRACVDRYVAEGASVLAVDRDDAALTELADANDGRLATMTVDVADPGSARSMVDRALEAFGRLDAFHANAGGAFPTPFADVDDAEYERVRSLNLDAVWQSARASIPVFTEAGGGVFLVTSSGGGTRAVEGLAAYGAAKAGVQALVRGLALEYGRHGIRANAISPGPIESPGLLAWLATTPGGVEAHVAEKPMRRLGKPEEIASAAAFLLSDDASFVNGITLPVDGGALAAL